MPSAPHSPDHPVPPAEATSSFPQYQVRLGVNPDASRLEPWLQASQPLPVPAARARRLMLDDLLAQSGRGVCVLAESEHALLAVLPVVLTPSLSFGGLVACATEWWPATELPATAGSACLAACCETLADWGRAHGIRHVLLAPGLSAGGLPSGFALHANGMWHLNLMPAAKVLG